MPSSSPKKESKINNESKRPLGENQKVSLGCGKEKISIPDIKILESIECYKHYFLHALELSWLALKWEIISPNPPDSYLCLPIYAQILLPNLSNTLHQSFIQHAFLYVIINDILRTFDPAIPKCFDS